MGVPTGSVRVAVQRCRRSAESTESTYRGPDGPWKGPCPDCGNDRDEVDLGGVALITDRGLTAAVAGAEAGMDGMLAAFRKSRTAALAGLADAGTRSTGLPLPRTAKRPKLT